MSSCDWHFAKCAPCSVLIWEHRRQFKIEMYVVKLVKAHDVYQIALIYFITGTQLLVGVYEGAMPMPSDIDYFKKFPDGLVESHAGTGRKLCLAPASAGNNGALPPSPSAIRDPKRQRVGSPEVKKPTSNPRQSLPLHEERCCSCTKHSTCLTSRCNCLSKCWNIPSKNPMKEITKAPAPQMDKFPAPARVLDLSSVAVTTQKTNSNAEAKTWIASQEEFEGTPDPEEE